MPETRWLCTGRLAVGIGMALVLLILFVRKPGAFVHPQFWAEDGSLFFTQQIAYGARAHLIPYAGTFNEVPRIVASLGALLPHRHVPAFYNAAAVLVLLALVCKLYSPRSGLPCPLPFALAVALVPHPGGEVFACLANVQWVLALLLLVCSLQKSPATGAQAAGDAALVLCAGLTGPFIFFALPLFGWKLLQSFRSGAHAGLRESRLELPVFGVALGTAAVQIWALFHSSIAAPAARLAAPGVWARLVGHRLFGTLFLGPLITYRLSPILLAIAGLLVLGGILWALRRSPEAFEKACLSLLFAAAVAAGAFAKHAAAPGLLVPWANGSRYFFIPAVVVAWCLLLVLATGRGVPRLLATAALAALLTASVLSRFQSPPLEDLRWEKQAERIGGSEPVVSIPIHPRGWRVHIPQHLD